jgi:hypothetical protein
MKNGKRNKTSAAENPRERTDLRPRVEIRAYELWLEDGCRHGHDLNHWLQAEGEIAHSGPR